MCRDSIDEIDLNIFLSRKQGFSYIIDSELHRMLIEYNEIIECLSGFRPTTEKQARIGKQKLRRYRELQDILMPILTKSLLRKIHENKPPSFTVKGSKITNKNKKMLNGGHCYICEYPITFMLEAHHKIMRSVGGSNDKNNCVSVCSNCHKLIHYCIKKDGISSAVKDYYGIEPEMLSKLEEIIEIGRLKCKPQIKTIGEEKALTQKQSVRSATDTCKMPTLRQK
jgi:hypothetical protein